MAFDASVPVLLFIHYFEHLKGVEDWRSNWLLGVMLGSMENEKLTNTATYALPGGFLESITDGVCRRRLYETRTKHC